MFLKGKRKKEHNRADGASYKKSFTSNNLQTKVLEDGDSEFFPSSAIGTK